MNAGTGFHGLSGSSEAMRKLERTIRKMSARSTPVLILGETGTGKELVARAIHAESAVAQKPFVTVDCGALSPQVIESELFGHVKGAFTGAESNKTGLLVTADGGTVFLDEIGELPPELQTKFLRAIQEKEVRPVGANKAVPFSARFIAATNRDLKEDVRTKRFREDLYYRLAVVTIQVPPLRDRREDIRLLAEEFLRKFAPVGFDTALTAEAIGALQAHDWPGNVRELQNCIERAVALNTNGPIRIADLGSSLQHVSNPPLGMIEESERRAILHALAKTGGNKIEAAKLLGIGKTTLYRKLKDYGIEASATNA